MKGQLIDVAVIGESAPVCSAFALSNEFPFVSREPNGPDLS